MATELVKKDDLVTVTGTGQNKFLKAGKVTTMHRIAAEKLVERGAATLVGEGKPLIPAKKKGKGKK